MQKVIVGMSGGVDSSVTAYILKKEGYDVEGISFILCEAQNLNPLKPCCSLQAIGTAEKTARQLRIRHSIIDARKSFISRVVRPFVNAYYAGTTPNPCILCNRHIKFPYLLKEAEKRDAQYIATGHYAKVEHINKLNNPPSPPFRKGGMGGFENSYFFLKKGIDPKKDQSYFLYILRQEELKRLILPLGYYKKNEVRKIAQDLDLSAVKRPESQEVCFIEDRNYFHFIERFSSFQSKTGPIVDSDGNVIGTHKGIHNFTIGQRKGLGISSRQPLYVLKIDAVKNIVYVGNSEAAKMKEIFVGRLNWINPPIPPLVKGGEGEVAFRALVKVRSAMKEQPATINVLKSKKLRGVKAVRITFDEPQWAPAPGQSAVFYDGDIVTGGGIIFATHI
jgi:tRNA-specific 2-thiouridylase